MPTPLLRIDEIREHWMAIFGPHLHLKQARCLADGAIGAMHADRLGVNAVGRGLARARELDPKHAIKQVDRLLSNPRVEMDTAFLAWVPAMLAERREIVVALDWTEYADDEHHTIACYLISDHGRATPLVWRSHEAASLLAKRGRYEEQLLSTLRKAVPAGVRVIVLADRAFGSATLYRHLRKLGFDFVIRFRGCIYVRTSDGRYDQADEFLDGNGEPIRFDNVEVTAQHEKVAGFVNVWEKGMKEPWYLATSLPLEAREIVRLYGRRFTIEEAFRDEKDRRFGMGLLESSIGDCGRRDRMLLIGAMARVIFTVLGSAGEELDLAKRLRANTESEKRTHSLFRQGWEYFHGAVARYAAELRTKFHARMGALATNAARYAVI
jgi:hypothetical protein